MSIKNSPLITSSRLLTFFDAANSKCSVSGTTEWKVYGTNHEFTIGNGMYDPLTKTVSTDGTDDKFQLPKDYDVTIDWGKTLSIHCNPNPGAFIFNDNGALILRYTESKKVCLFCSPPSHIWGIYSANLIDENNDITLINNSSNHNGSIIKMDLEGKIKGFKYDTNQTFTRTYGFGKIVESGGYQYYNTSRGFTKSLDFFIYDTPSQAVSDTILNSYQGDLDIDSDDYIYITGYYYDNKAYKTPKSSPLTPISFGGTGAGTTGLTTPYGISVGTNYVFVSDSGNHRVVVLNKADMTYNTQLGVTGSAGSTIDKFNLPRSSIVKNGYLYVTDFNNARVKIYDELTLEYVDVYGSLGINPAYISANSNYLLISNGTTIRVYKISDKSLVLNKTFIGTGGNGPGGYYVYGAKAIFHYNSNIYVFDRGNTYVVVDPEELSVLTGVTINMGDVYEAARDDTHMYLRSENGYGFRKMNVVTKVQEGIINVNGTGDGQFALNNNTYCGIAVDDNYVYVSDASNDRIQIFNKSDLSFYSKFGVTGAIDDGLHFRQPGGLLIQDGKFYVCDYGNSKVRVFSYPSLEYITSFSVLSPRKIRVDGDEIFVASQSYKIDVYDSTTFTLKRSKTYPVYPYTGGLSNMISGIEVVGDRLFLVGDFKLVVCDKNTLAFDAELSPFYKCALADISSEDSNVFVDIVFTSDYKVKIYFNGVESNTLDFNSTYNFKTSFDLILGNLRSKYSSVKYNWIALYDKEKTLDEHIKDYHNLGLRFR